MRAGALLLLLASASLAAQEQGEPATNPNPFPKDTFSSRNPYVVRGDSAYTRRQEGRNGAVADSRRISEAIAAYQTAAEAPDNLEARWKLARALYFKGEYTGLDPDQKKAVFSQARRFSEDAITILGRRVERKSGREILKLSPADRAEALPNDPDAAPTFFWAAVSWGQWALAVGKTQAATAGAADRIRDYAETVIEIDPQYEEGGGYRILGRLHDQAPHIPVLTPWVSREEAVRNLRLAVSIDSRNFVNRHFLAEALSHGNAEEKAEALRLEEALVADSPSPQHLIEELAIQEKARKNLEEWRRSAVGRGGRGRPAAESFELARGFRSGASELGRAPS